jgi:hypothetical protein
MPNPKNKDLTSGISATALKPLAAVIYAAAANQDDKMMQYVGSTVLNRLESGKSEFGAQNGRITEVINNPNSPYYEKDDTLYKQFISGNFKDDKSKKAAMRAASIASALTRGTLDRMDGEFWFNAEEESRLRKNKRVFDFDKVEEIGTIGLDNQFKTYGYPKAGRTMSASAAMKELGVKDVKGLQQVLIDNGETPGIVDGKFGPKTNRAFMSYKKKIAGKR